MQVLLPDPSGNQTWAEILESHGESMRPPKNLIRQFCRENPSLALFQMMLPISEP